MTSNPIFFCLNFTPAAIKVEGYDIFLTILKKYDIILI